MFGRHPQLPIDVELHPQEESLSETTEVEMEAVMEKLLETHHDLANKANLNIKEAQKQQKSTMIASMKLSMRVVRSFSKTPLRNKGREKNFMTSG